MNGRDPGRRGTALLDRGDRNVNVQGAIADSIIVTGDGNRVVVERDSAAGLLLEVELRSQILPTPRPSPVDERGRTYVGHVGRRREAEEFLKLALSEPVVNLEGDAGIGKSYLVAYALHQRSHAILPDGVVYLPAKGEPVQDVIQALFDAFYDCPAILPSSKIRGLLRSKQALIVLDSFDRSPDEVQLLLSFAPECNVVLCTRERSEGVPFHLEGLNSEDAVTLLERELGRAVSPGERQHAQVICELLGGHPLRIRHAISTLDGGRTLEELAARLEQPEAQTPSLDPDQTAVLRALAALGEAAVGLEHLEALIPLANLRDLLNTLQRGGLVRSYSPRYSITPAVPTELMALWDLDAERKTSLNYFLGWAEHNRLRYRDLLVESPALLELFEWASRSGRHADTIRLGRAIETAFAWGRRWGMWERILTASLEAARSLGDRTTEAWALHQLGTRVFCLGETKEAVRLLRQALRIRKRIGDRAGTKATRQNLSVVKPPRLLAFLKGIRLGPFVFFSLLISLGIFVGPRVQQLLDGLGSGRSSDQSQVGTSTVSFSVELAGGGAGTIASSPMGIECPGRCTASFPAGSELRLFASAGEESTFTGWSGECAGTETCLIQMDEDGSATATFEKAAGAEALTVALGGNGSGSVFSSPSGIMCPPLCGASFSQGTEVTLIPTANEGSVFLQWEGACSGAGSCTPEIRGRTSVIATFSTAAVPTKQVRVALSGTGKGTVSSLPMGIKCPPVCQANFAESVPVDLTAVPSQGSELTGWTGACGSSKKTCSVPEEYRGLVTATFAKAVSPPVPIPASVAKSEPAPTYSVDVEVYREEGEGPFGGTFEVVGECSSGANHCILSEVPAGKKLLMRVEEEDGFEFDGWPEECNVIGEDCVLTVDSDVQLLLTFSPFP